MDIFKKNKRKLIMSHIKSKNTKPEIYIGTLIHKMGFRFKKHVKSLPGNPDIVLSKYRKVIFVNGCFWHGHKNCIKSTLPTSNKNFWGKKLNMNILRDKKNIRLLKKQNWQTMVIWQCQLKNRNNMRLIDKLKIFLYER